MNFVNDLEDFSLLSAEDVTPIVRFITQRDRRVMDIYKGAQLASTPDLVNQRFIRNVKRILT